MYLLMLSDNIDLSDDLTGSLIKENPQLKVQRLNLERLFEGIVNNSIQVKTIEDKCTRITDHRLLMLFGKNYTRSNEKSFL